MAKKLIAVCGLDCSKCGAYLALQNNDDGLRVKTAQEWTKNFGHVFQPQDINCVGCCVDGCVHGGYCHACPLRACALGKKLANCYVCSEFQSCQKVKDFEKQSGMSIEGNFRK